MYIYDWDKNTGGIVLTANTSLDNKQYVSRELRPVWARELKLIGLDKYFLFDENEIEPICWGIHGKYYYHGEVIAELVNPQYGQNIELKVNREFQRLLPIDIDGMLHNSQNIKFMDALISDSKKRIKELYDKYSNACDIAYIAFSGGKDSVLLLDLCLSTLPQNIPVIFSDTDMELPDTYLMWEQVQQLYPSNTFYKVKASTKALDNWHIFGPPSGTVRWCCSIHKSTPAILFLKKILNKNSVFAHAFVGVRNEESYSRSDYVDSAVGVKNASQISSCPVLSWGAHELWLYTFANNLPINPAYKKGLSRVGCVLCPESSARHSWFMSRLYPKEFSSFESAMLETVNKEFKSEDDKNSYIANGWRARRDGLVLKEPICRPQEKTTNSEVSWIVPKEKYNLFKMWTNTLGNIVSREDGTYSFSRNIRGAECNITFNTAEDLNSQVIVTASFENNKELKLFSKFFRQCVNKSLACVSCSACEAECPTGALRFNDNKISIDPVSCVHCLKCHDIDFGCWRFKSMSVSETVRNEMNAINKYTKFGLRLDWLYVYLDEREAIANTTRLGTMMIPSSKVWFRQALMMEEKNCNPTKVLEIANKFGAESKIVWECIWAALSNNSALIKWYVTNVKVDTPYTTDDLFVLLGDDLKPTTRNGGLITFRDMLTKSPFGTGSAPMVELTMKGKTVDTMTRVSHPVEDLALLYGLFVMAGLAEQTSFSISNMMSADFSAKAISPLLAFALPIPEFKQQCIGLADRYPDFIHANFTLGLDEVIVKTDSKSLDDVVELMLQG